MMAEYAEAYGGPPAPGEAWPLVVALSRRVSQFWARRQLVSFDAVGDAVATMFSGDPTQGELIREGLELRAYPVSGKAGPKIIQNAWGEKPPAEEPTDA